MSRRSHTLVVDFDAPFCDSAGKRGFESRERAEQQLGRARAHRRMDRGYKGCTEKAVYRCKGCGLWHLTSRGKR